MITELQQWIIYGFMGYIIIMFVIIVLFELRRRNKIAIRILTSIGRRTKWISPQFEGNIIYALIRKENKRKSIPEWKAKVTQVLDFPKWFGRRGREAYIMPESPETITFDFEGNGIEQPMWDKKASTEYINAKALKQEGEGFKAPIPMWVLYLTLLVSIASGFISFLIYLKLGRF